MTPRNAVYMSVVGDTLNVVPEGALRDRLWSETFGSFQQAVRTGQLGDSTFASVRVDLRYCTWIDPTPMLALIAEFLWSSGTHRVPAELLLPNPDNCTVEAARLCRFLAQEGFLGEAAEAGFGLRVGESPLNAVGLVDRLATLDVPLTHERATFIPAHVRAIESAEDVRRIVVQSMEECRSSYVFDLVPAWARNDLLYRLELILRELLENSVDHAYPNSNVNVIAYYVRYRFGERHVAPDTQHQWIAAVTIEGDKRFSPLLPGSYWPGRAGCLELFVSDVGVGITGSLRSEPLHPSIRRRNFHSLFVAVLRDGVRRRHQDRQTPSGGLTLCAELLEESNDYLRAFESSTWVAAYPMLRDGAMGSMLRCTPAREGVSALGLHWTVRLSWRDPHERQDGRWQRWEASGAKSPLIRVLGGERDRRTLDADVLDQRYETPETFERPGARTFLLLPKPRLTKNEILDLTLKCASTRGRYEALVIADIPSREAATYLSALDGARRCFYQFEIPDRVILVTQSLSVCVLTATQALTLTTHGVETETYLDPTADSTTIETNLIALIGVLQLLDSRRFWATVLSSGENGPFLGKAVRWAEGQEPLFGYLDFSQTLTDQRLVETYLRAIHRLEALGAPGRVRLRALDRQASTLTEEFNESAVPAQGDQNSREDRVMVDLGSVLATGISAFGSSLEDDDEPSVTVYLFRHPFPVTRTGTSYPTLLLWPEVEWIRRKFPAVHDDPRPYARVGRTPAVAPGGRYYFPIPRYCEDGSSASFQPPTRTYRDWQRENPAIVKVGHWRTGSHHDLITVNLFQAVRSAFRERNELAGFLIKSILGHLGCRPDALRGSWQSWVERNGLLDASRYRGIVVFAANSKSDAILDGLRRVVKTDQWKLLQDRIMLLRPMRNRVGGSALLVSPLAIERVRDMIHTFPGEQSLTEVLIFDDAVITGRTLLELQALLREAGATHQRSAVILNRSRLPTVERNMEHFWRLDVPTLDGRSGCYLCRGLSRADSLRPAVALPHILHRLDDWQEMWAPVSSISEWNRALRPIRIDIERPEKRFGLRYDFRKQQYEPAGDPIRIGTSTGYTVYACELHAMTAQDDLGIAAAAEETLPDIAKIELLASQLLLFEEEYDRLQRAQILEALLKLVADRQPDEYSALVGIVLIGQTAQRVTADVVGRWLRGIAQSAEHINIDVGIAIAYLIHHGLLPNDGPPRFCRMLTTAANELAGVYANLHMDLWSSLGNAHSTKLWNFLKSEDIGTRLTYSRGAAALLRRYRSYLSRLMRSDALLFSDRTAGVEDPDRVLERAAEMLDALDGALDDRSTVAATKEAYEVLVSLHRELFFPLDAGVVNRGESEGAFVDSELLEITRELSDEVWARIVQDKCSRHPWLSVRWNRHLPRIGYSPSGQMIRGRDEKWVLWDARVQRVMRDLITNAVHSIESIPDPWGVVSSMADIWLAVRYDETCLAVLLVNKSALSVHEIARTSELKGRWEHLVALGGSVKHRRLEEGRVEVRVELPYAHSVVDRVHGEP